MPSNPNCFHTVTLYIFIFYLYVFMVAVAFSQRIFDNFIYYLHFFLWKSNSSNSLMISGVSHKKKSYLLTGKCKGDFKNSLSGYAKLQIIGKVSIWAPCPKSSGSNLTWHFDVHIWRVKDDSNFCIITDIFLKLNRSMIILISCRRPIFAVEHAMS